ncbi:MAG: S8 family peptidase [Bacteroidota bacterium]
MRNRWLLLSLILSGCGTIPGPRISPAAEVILTLRPGAEEPRLGTVLNRFEMGKSFRVLKLPEGMSPEAGVETLSKDPGVECVRANRFLPKGGQPNDPLFSLQWGFERIEPQPCWDRLIDGSKVLVAVLDTGVDYDHPDLAGRVVKGYNFADGNTEVKDHDGHGTHVAGIIGASGNNHQGVCGILWNVNLLAIKVLNEQGGTDANALAGLKYAVDNGAKVINLSFNSKDTAVNPLYQTAIDYARSHGALVVAAAGNDGGEVTYPANTPGCIAVSATGKYRRWEWLAPFSNRGTCVSLSAPGAGILSTVPGGKYETYSGTSMAAPFVSGAAATLMALHPDWTLEQIEQRLRQATDDLGDAGKDPLYGYGRINLSKLLD